MHVVEILQHLDLLKFDQQLELHFIELILTINKLLILLLNGLHLLGQLQLQLSIVVFFDSQVLLEQLDFLLVLLDIVCERGVVSHRLVYCLSELGVSTHCVTWLGVWVHELIKGATALSSTKGR